MPGCTRWWTVSLIGVSEGPTDVVPDDDRAVVEQLRAAYEQAAHGLPAAGHATQLPDASSTASPSWAAPSTASNDCAS
jgi:hypothetical protein